MSARLLEGGPVELTPTTFVQDAIQALQDHGDNIFLNEVKTKKTYTYRDVHERASGIANKVKELGLKSQDVLMVISNVTAEALTTIIGVWISGASTSSINPAVPIDEMADFIRLCKSRVVYAGEEFCERVLSAVGTVEWPVTVISPNGKSPAIDYFDCISPTELVTEVEQPLGLDNQLAVMFTSGTTGVSKGVINRDEYFKFNSTALGKYHFGGTYMMSSPLYWISNPLLLSMNLLSGGMILITDKFTPEQLLEVITEYKPDQWFTGPSTLIDMCNLPDLERFDTSSIKKITVGGAAILAEHKKFICETLFEGRSVIYGGYGSTEAGMITVDKVAETDLDSETYESIGQVIDGVTVKFVDTSTGELVGPYTPGEICVRSPSILKGYINKEITESEIDAEGFWHMGDIGYYDEEGYVFYQTRLKDVMKYRGQQIAPAELEAIIQKHPDVIESAVVGKPSPEHGDLPTAFVVKRPGSKVTQQELYDFVSNYVIDEKKLRGGIYFIDNLPRSTVGKILRRDLVKMLTA